MKLSNGTHCLQVKKFIPSILLLSPEKKYFKPHCKVAPKYGQRTVRTAGWCKKQEPIRGGSPGIQRVKIRCHTKNFFRT